MHGEARRPCVRQSLTLMTIRAWSLSARTWNLATTTIVTFKISSRTLLVFGDARFGGAAGERQDVRQADGATGAETTICYLVRHAHAEWRDDDSRPLSEAGIAAAGVLAERLASRPIAAVYTSPSRRSVETVEPLASRLGLCPEVVPDLRERELPTVPPSEFEALVRQAWRLPAQAAGGGESNVQAQVRGLAVVRTAVARHAGLQVVAATHGNLLALVLNALDPSFAYEFWRGLSFPDVYQVTFRGTECCGVERLWNA